MEIQKKRRGIFYLYDTDISKYYQEHNKKWVKDPRPPKTIINKKSKELKYTYYNFDIDYINKDTLAAQERNYIFLTLLCYKNDSCIKYNERSNNKEDVSPYFSYAQVKQLLGKRHVSRIDALIRFGYIEFVSELLKYDANKTLHHYIPTQKLLDLRIGYKKTIISGMVITSVSNYYDLQTERLHNYKDLFNFKSNNSLDITLHTYNKLQKENYPKYVKNKIKKGEEDGIKSLDEYIKIGKEEYKRIKEYNRMYKVEKLTFNSKDTFGNRFHTRFSNIPSRYRQYIRGGKDGEFLDYSIDAQNSQLLFLAHLFSLVIKDSDFVKDINNGDMYKLMMFRKGFDERDDAKEYFFKLLFGEVNYPNGKRNEKHYDFANYYPKEARIIEIIKTYSRKVIKREHPIIDSILTEYDVDFDWLKEQGKKQYTALSCLLQRMETTTWFKIWSELKENDINFENIHDEVIVNRSNGDKATEIVKNNLDSFLPKIKVVLKNK